MSDQPSSSRLDRVEMVVEKLADRLNSLEEKTQAIADETRNFQVAVRGAIMAQQEQIAENSRSIAALTREWQAYLRTIHPKQ